MKIQNDADATEKLSTLAGGLGWDMEGAAIRRTSSRACLSVEHGDYNGTHLFGFGTDRFIWVAYKPRRDNTVRLFSGNFEDDGVIEYQLNRAPAPTAAAPNSWARFPYGIDLSLRDPDVTFGEERFTHQEIDLQTGLDAVIIGNIPDGGMSRSASLSINLISSLLDVNGITLDDDFELCTMARAAEHSFGSTCGILDQVMIAYAMEGHGTHYDPATNEVHHVPYGGDTDAFSFVVMDTGTERPGLEKARYVIRQKECWGLAEQLRNQGYEDGNGDPVVSLADVTPAGYEQIMERNDLGPFADHIRRLKYVHEANQRFPELLAAWQRGDIEQVGAIFRADGIGLRDDYELSWKEADTMCDIVRSIEGVHGERMLGGGDAGAAGALVSAAAVETVKQGIHHGFPKSHPDYQKKYAIHTTKMVAGNVLLDTTL